MIASNPAFVNYSELTRTIVTWLQKSCDRVSRGTAGHADAYSRSGSIDGNVLTVWGVSPRTSVL